jgi:arginyl-tRNA synthetase
LRKAADLGIAPPTGSETDLAFSGLTQPEEIALIQKLVEFPNEIQQAIATLAPHRIARYALDLAALLHNWYDRGGRNPDLRILVEQDVPLSRTRLALAVGVRATLAGALILLGVSAPERMTETEPTAAVTTA